HRRLLAQRRLYGPGEGREKSLVHVEVVSLSLTTEDTGSTEERTPLVHAGLRKWCWMASAWLRVTTAESAAVSACLTACTLPKCSSKRRVALAPTPGISSSSVERSRIWRRLRWKVTAKRCASSRMSWIKCSTGEWWSRTTGSFSCPYT